MAVWQKGIGFLVTETGSYTIPFVISGIAPLFGFFVLLLFWGKTEKPALASEEEPRHPAEPDTRITGTAASVQAAPPG